jgi:hypothetical protein
MSPLTGVLTEAWDLYRRFAAHFLLISFVIYLITAVLVALLALAGRIGLAFAWIIEIVALFVLEAVLVKAVQDVRDGRVDLNLGQTYRASVPYLLPVVGASILAAIAIWIGFLLLIVPGLILLTFWCLIVPFIVIGGAGVFDSFGQSMRTVRGYGWQVFGTFVLVFLLWIALNIVVSLILLFLSDYIRGFVSSVVAGTLFAPFVALVATLVYYRLTAAHASQPYTVTGPAGATVWEPPYPTTEAPADSPTPPPTEPGATKPYPTTPGPTEPGATEPGPTAPGATAPGATTPPPTEPAPDSGPDKPPPPATP